MEPIACPDCGAENQSDAECTQCGHPLVVHAASQATKLPAAEASTPPKHPQFGMGSMMITVTLMAVMLGLLRLAPGLGLPLVIIVAPAFLRATVLATRKKAAGQRLDFPGKLKAFLGSIGLILAVLLAVGCTYLLSCGAGLVAHSADLVSDDVAIIGSNVVGVLAQLAFTILFICWLWMHRVDQKNRLGDIGFVFSWGGFVMINGVLLFELIVPAWRFAELAGWGFVAVPGVLFSLIALPRPHRSLASCGVGFGLAAVVATILYLSSGYTNLRRPFPSEAKLWMTVLVAADTIAAIGVSATFYYLARLRQAIK